MWNFHDTFKTRKRSFVSASSICIAVPLSDNTLSKITHDALLGASLAPICKMTLSGTFLKKV